MLNRIKNLQALRGVAVLLVLLLHLYITEKGCNPNGILPDWMVLGHSGVDLFFVISGFIMTVITTNYTPGLRSMGIFLYHRWTRIYPTYWFWLLTSILIHLISPSWLHFETWQSLHLIEAFILSPTWTTQFIPVSWTLKYELYFYLICSVTLLFPVQHRIFILLMWGCYVIIGQSICYDAPHILCSKVVFLTVHPLVFEFLCGYLIGFIYLQRRTSHSFMLMFIGMCLITSSMIFYLWSELNIDDNIWYRVLLFGLPFAVLLYGCVEMERQHCITAPHWLIGIGNASYSIYLSHLLLINIIFRQDSLHAILSTSSLNVITLIITLTIGILGYYWIERPLLVMTYISV